MRRTALCSVGAMALCGCTSGGTVLGQQPDAGSQPGTRLSVDELKQQMFQLSAGRRLKPASWRAGARIAVALSFDVEGHISGLKFVTHQGKARLTYSGAVPVDTWRLPTAFLPTKLELMLPPVELTLPQPALPAKLSNRHPALRRLPDGPLPMTRLSGIMLPTVHPSPPSLVCTNTRAPQR